MKRIIAFLISCAVIVAIAVGITNCASLEKTRHQIKYVVDGEEYYSQPIFSAAEISLPEEPKRENYDFDGWYYDEDVWNEAFDASAHGKILTEDIVVYAKWVPHVHIIVKGKLTKTASGINFNGDCSVCGMAVNNVNVVTKNQTKPATCFKEGEITYNYTYMGETYSLKETTPILEHQLGGKKISTLLDSNSNLPLSLDGVTAVDDIACGKTGAATYKCDLCKQTQSVIAIRDVHEYGDWTLTRDVSGKYTATSTCTVDGCESPAASYLISSSDGLIENKQDATCEAPGYIKASINSVKNGYKIVAEFETVIPTATNHLINGVDINNIINEDKDPDSTDKVYCINYYDENGESYFKNVNQACDTVFEAYFYCSHCKEQVLVLVYKPHYYVETNSANCTTPGQLISSCKACGQSNPDHTPTDTQPLGHSYEIYKLELVGNFDYLNYANNVFNITEKCKACGEERKINDVAYNEVNFNITPPAVSSVDCKVPEIYTISYTAGGITISCTASVTNHLNHKLNGMLYKDLLEMVGGELVIKSDIPGLTIFGDGVCYEQSHELYSGMFSCETCGGSIRVANIYVVHQLDANDKCTDCGYQQPALTSLRKEEEN